MSDPNQDKSNAEAKAMTAAEAAKRVKRIVVTVEGEGDKAKEVTRKVAVDADEVLAHKDYGTHVVVVTKDGQKLTNKAGE